MAISVDEKMAKLPDDRRAKIEIRAAELIAEEMARRQLQPTDAAPSRARGRQS